MRHRAFAAAMAIKKVSAHSLCIQGIRDTWAPSPAPGQALFKPMPGAGKRRWKSGRVKPARASESLDAQGVHSVRNVSARPVQPLDRQCPGFHMMASCVAIRISCFTRHCFRAASPPYPSTAVDFRKALDRLTKPVEADGSSSPGLALHHAQRPARTPSSVSTSCRHTGVTAIVCTRSHTESRGSPPPLPRHAPCHYAVGTPLFLSPAGTFACFHRRERWRKSCKRHRIISEKKRVFLRALWAWSTEFIARSGDIRERSTVSQIPVPAWCFKVPSAHPFFGGTARMMATARRPTAVHREPASGVFSTSQQGKFHDEDINGSRYRQCPA